MKKINRAPRVYRPSDQRRQEFINNTNLYNPVQIISNMMVLEDFNAYELAEATGIHHNTIYNWINHSVQPSHANFLATINAMGYTMALTVIKD